MSLEAVRVRLGDGFYAGAMRNPTQQPGWPVHSERQTSLDRSEEHTSELQSRQYLVCRLLLEKKKRNTPRPTTSGGRTAARGELLQRQNSAASWEPPIASTAL